MQWIKDKNARWVKDKKNSVSGSFMKTKYAKLLWASSYFVEPAFSFSLEALSYVCDAIKAE